VCRRRAAPSARRQGPSSSRRSLGCAPSFGFRTRPHAQTATCAARRYPRNVAASTPHLDEMARRTFPACASPGESTKLDRVLRERSLHRLRHRRARWSRRPEGAPHRFANNRRLDVDPRASRRTALAQLHARPHTHRTWSNFRPNCPPEPAEHGETSNRPSFTTTHASGSPITSARGLAR